MMPLTCRNFDLTRARLDLFTCGCSSNKSYSNGLYRDGSNKNCGVRKLVCNSSSEVARCRAFSPAKTPEAVLNVVPKDPEPVLDTKPESSSNSNSISSLLEVVADDLLTLNNNLQSIIGAENPVLISAAEQIFGAGGKRMRPALVFLVSRATAGIQRLKELTPKHRRLAEIIEMIHTASLIHDDVLDDSSVRRGKKTIHQIYGTRVAILAGDFMFAQSSWYLANLENIEVIKLISQVIKDFASGEIKQASSLFDCDVTLEEYLMKSYYKTASLIAASTKGAAIFSGVDRSVCEQMYEFGKNLGLSFQVVDDILDFTQSEVQLGKPAGMDLAKGNLTAPVIFALEKEPKLREIIDNEFNDAGSFEEAVKLIISQNQNPNPLLLILILGLVWTMATTAQSSEGGSSDAAVHIVYCEKPEGEEPEAYHLKTLASVLGSEAAAKDAILYSYKTAASGFSAKLTPQQVSQISKEPGVLQVVPSRTYQLHSGPAKLH